MPDNIKSIIEIGQNIEIEVIGDESSAKSLKSTIVDIISDDLIVIATPIYKKNVYPISLGKKLKIMVNVKDLGNFYFTGTVIKREAKDNLHNLYIECDKKIFKNQRRNYYRLNIMLNVELAIVKEEESEEDEKIFKGITKDISGGGVRVVLKEDVPINSKVRIMIKIDSEIITVTGIVVRKEQVTDSAYKWDLGIQFIDIDEGTRSKIISFIFDKQRKLIQRGLI